MIYKSRKQRTFPAFSKQMTGIEPASPAWEAGILPMNYICIWHVKNYTSLSQKLQAFSHRAPNSVSLDLPVNRVDPVFLQKLIRPAELPLPKNPRKADSGLG